MRPNLELLDLYKEEKSRVIGSPDERTGLENFPSWPNWLEAYKKDFWLVHETVDVKVADARAEAAIEEFDTNGATVALLETETENTPMTETKTTKPASKKDKPTMTATKAPSKSAQAQKVFDKMYPDVVAGKAARKDVIAKFTGTIGLTDKGASTYYQRMKKAFDASA